MVDGVALLTAKLEELRAAGLFSASPASSGSIPVRESWCGAAVSEEIANA
jgi:hypothetical protein